MRPYKFLGIPCFATPTENDQLMEYLYSEILEAIGELRTHNSIREIHGNERIDLLENIQALFVKGNPRVWWESLRYAPVLMDDDGSSSQYLKVAQFLPQNQTYYFIADLSRFHIFEGVLRDIIEIIGNCSFFEYYIVDKELSTLLCETDHGAIYMSKREGV